MISMPTGGDVLGAISNVVGGFINRDASNKANDTNYRIAQQNMALQKQFAQEGIRWKVDDAKAAGIHPLYALGATTHSFSPVSAGAVADTSLGNAMAAAGQDLSRSMNSTRTSEERNSAFSKTVEQLTLQKMGLENDLLSSQIAKLRSTTNPPMPTLAPPGGPVPVAKDYEDAPRLNLGAGQLNVDRHVTNTDDFTKRYGESADWWAGPYVMWRDYTANYGNPMPRSMGPYIRPGSVLDRFYTSGREFDARFGHWK